MTAVVYCIIILTISSWSQGHGLENDEDACRSLYYRCKRVSYEDCIQSEDFHFCSQDDNFVRDIINSHRSEVEDHRTVVDSEPAWAHERPRGSKREFGRSEHRGADRDRYDTEDQSLRDSGDVLVHIIDRLYKDRKESPAKVKEFDHGSRSEDLELSRKREMVLAALKRRKQVERRDNSAERDLRIQFTYNDPEDEDEEERRSQRAEENDNYGEFASYVSGFRDSDGPGRQGIVAPKHHKEEEPNWNTYDLGKSLRNPVFSAENHHSNDVGRIANLDRIANLEDRGKELLNDNSKESSHELPQGSSGGSAFQDTRVPSYVAGQKPQNTVAVKHKKKDLIFVEVEGNDDIHIIAKSEDQPNTDQDQGHVVLYVKNGLNNTAARVFANKLQNILWGIKSTEHAVFPQLSSHDKIITLHMVTNSAWFKANENAKDVATHLNADKALRAKITKETGVEIESVDSRGAAVYHHPVDANIADWDQFALVTAIVGGCTLGIIAAAVVVCCIKRRRRKGSLVDLKKQEAISDYQELLRTQMSINSSDPPRGLKASYDQERHGLVNGQGKVMRKAWGEEPQRYNMNISTGHVVLAYMEDHLKNEDRLNKEWEVLCCYEADPKDTTAGIDPVNARKNRYADILPFDHSRVKLKETANLLHSDYVNANFITDVDPHNPAYIATQGPLENTVADFWQMVWEHGVVVIVNLTRLSDMGMSQCYRYWPEDGSEVYHMYEVHLISEHIWCDDYLVRSFYLKNIQTAETRTVTQFHFLTWPDLSVPDSPKALLEFRRKVNKCYRGQSCPIIVHCNDGVGRTGTYILVDLVLNSMMKGAKEIDIAATLEHLRDQRPDMVKAKAQFEFALAAVAEEVTAILTSLPS